MRKGNNMSCNNLAVTPHPRPQAQEELSPLTGTQQLWDQLCGQADEVHQLVILHHIVLLNYFPHEGRHEPHRRDEEVQGGCRERGAWREHLR